MSSFERDQEPAQGLDARVAEVAMPAEIIEATTSCPEVERIFSQRSDLSCLVVRDVDRRAQGFHYGRPVTAEHFDVRLGVGAQ